MLNTHIPDRVSTTLMKHFIIVSLFVPYFISKTDNLYFPDYILSVFFALIIAFCMFQWRDLKFSREKIVAFLLIAALFIYDVVASYVNLKYLHWYQDEINVTVCFGFMIVLLLSEKTDRQILTDKVIKFLIHSIIISNILAMILYFKRYYGILFMNGRMTFVPMDPDYYEVRFNWIYHHKCEYAFMLVCFIALFFVYRRLFKNKFTFGLSVAFLFACIVASHTFTSMIAAMCIPAGYMMDFLWKNRKKFKKIYLLMMIPFVAVAGVICVKILKERPVASLGKRIPIWKGVIPYIKEHFLGMGRNFSIELIDCPLNNKPVTNAHNVFLNQMLRFSIPVGIIFILIFVILIVGTILNRKNFLILAIWAAMLIPMNMDYCMLTNSLPMVMLLIYCIGFRKIEEETGKEKIASDA